MASSSEAVERPRAWRIRGRTLPLGGRTLVMGIVNVTPDSFSDGGKFFDPQAAIEQGRGLAADGADILDIGGESTRPGSDAVSEAEELRRVLPVIRGLCDLDVALSIDTRKAHVAKMCLAAGAHIINDVSGAADPAMGPLAAREEAGIVIMHMLGDPKTMQVAPSYADVVTEVWQVLSARARALERLGVPREAIMIDPGLGFGKRTGQGIEDNVALLKHVPTLRRSGYPVLIGASRKSFIGNILKVPLSERLEGSLAAAAIAAWNGAEVVRVHDVKPTRRVVDMVDAVRNAP